MRHCALQTEDGDSDLSLRERAGAAREAAVQRRIELQVCARLGPHPRRRGRTHMVTQGRISSVAFAASRPQPHRSALSALGVWARGCNGSTHARYCVTRSELRSSHSPCVSCASLSNVLNNANDCDDFSAVVPRRPATPILYAEGGCRFMEAGLAVKVCRATQAVLLLGVAACAPRLRGPEAALQLPLGKPLPCHET